MADVPSHLIASPVCSLCFTRFGALARVFCPLAAVLLVALAAPYGRFLLGFLLGFREGFLLGYPGVFAVLATMS